MAETLALGGPEMQVIPPSAEVLAMTAEHMGQTAVEQITLTDPAAQFEWPASDAPTRGVSYTVPSGDS